jgi:predicted permease
LAGSSLLTRALAPIVEERLGRRLPGGVSALALDGTLTIVALAAAALLTLGLTLAPLVTVWSTKVGTALKAAGRNVTDGRAAQRVRSVLIAGEIAAALALLVGSALMIQSAVRMLHVDPGLDVDGVVTTNIGLRPRSYPDPVRRAQFFERLLERLDEQTGPEGAALSDAWPLQTPRPYRVERAGDDPAAVEAGISRVTAGYFATLGLAFRDGRSFTAEDRVGGEPVVVVSESLARRLWPDGRAVGQTLIVPRNDAHDAAAAGLPRVVVAVVEDVTLVGYDDGRVQDSASPFQAYVPLLQDVGRFAFAYARHVSHAPDTVRDIAVALDREASVMPPRNLDTMFDEMRNGSRQLAWLLSAFAVFAAVLALLGVYSVMAYGVRQREREIGVRLVVGAAPRMVTRAFVREGSVMLACGLAVGLLGAVALGQALRNQLFGVDPVEPGTLAAGSAIFAACGLLAIWWPARRAARVDPARVLKDE